MAARKSKKRITTLESFFENILVCNDRKLRPFIETFYYDPENIAQEKLGTLFGIIEISDDSEDSSYIVNYLISVIRKEYFSQTKRGAVESLEAALHKANLALSKLAEHGSLAWLGNLNAIVAVIEKNNLHLSKAGDNSALLFRKKLLTDVSEDLKEENLKPHPLKTFVDVTSGRLENDDKLILTSEIIFEIFSQEEIKKSAIRFSNKEFNQFIRTAFSNEVSKAAMLIVNMKEKEEIVEMQPTPAIGSLNAFSQAAFSQITNEKKPEVIITEEIQETVEKQPNGHLYIKESEVSSSAESSISSSFMSVFKEKVSVFVPNQKPQQPTPTPNKSIDSKLDFQKLISNLLYYSNKIFKFTWKKLKILFIFLWRLIQIAYYKLKSSYENRRQEKISQETTYEIQEDQKPGENIIKKMLPKVSLLPKLLNRYTIRQKIITAAIILVFFIIVPILINIAWQSKENKNKITEIQSDITEAPLPLGNDKSIVRLEKIETVAEVTDLNTVIELNGSFFAIAKEEITDIQNKNKYPIPEDLTEIDLAFPMKDLDIILLLNKADKKITSFSPKTGKFQSNNFSLPENSVVVTGDTYLTYLYLLDQNSNQIYRYPRAEGGFGEKSDWKKDTTEINDSNEIAINENIFIINAQEILKLFRGKKIEFSFEESATPIIPSKLWTERDNTNLYVLDKTNSRIIKFDQEGKIINQFYHPEISEAQDFSVNEDQAIIFFSTINKVRSFSTSI